MLAAILFSASSVLSADEINMRATLNYQAEKYFMEEDFDRLELIMSGYREKEVRTFSGLWRNSALYFGFNNFMSPNIQNEQFWVRVRDKSEKWLTQHPESATANIVKGIMLSQYARKFVGRSKAAAIPEEARRAFKSNLQEAKEHMLRVKSVADYDPHWYVAMADIMKLSGVWEEEYMRNVDEGLNKFPNYYQLYFTTMDYLSMRWKSDGSDLKNFADDAVKRTAASDGDGLYARIYWYASQAIYGSRVFVDSIVDWERMKTGMADILNNYNDSWNLQNFAYFSCLSGDREMAKMMFNSMDSQPMLKQVWGKRGAYDSCMDFAYSTEYKRNAGGIGGASI
jgi:hypothetical protein